MALRQKYQRVTNEMPPAQLWLGQHETLVNQCVDYLQKTLCPNNGCATCVTCRQIADGQHHAIHWIHPEKQYTLEHLTTIFNTIAFAQEEKQKTFFILEHADFLTNVCANRLLKPMEEPPQGYYFILLAEQKEAILPTIRSRCVLKYHAREATLHEHQFFTIFSTTHPYDPADFLKLVSTSAPNERESVELINKLMRHWLTKEKDALLDNNRNRQKEAQTISAVFKKALQKPPMPGSSKLFWKNIFLQIKS